MSYAAVDQVAKAIPFSLDMTLEKATQISPQLHEMVATDPAVAQLIEMSMALEGMPRHASTHAAGVLITARPVTDYVPLQVNDEVVTTQFPMNTLEHLGLLKMDFLGLRTAHRHPRRARPDAGHRREHEGGGYSAGRPHRV